MHKVQKIALLCSLMPSILAGSYIFAADSGNNEEAVTENMKDAFLKLRQERDQLQLQFEAVKAKEKEYDAAIARQEQLQQVNQTLESHNKELETNLNNLLNDLKNRNTQEAELQKALDEKIAELAILKSTSKGPIADTTKDKDTKMPAIDKIKSTDPQKSQASYTVKKGDHLTKIAKKLCKNGEDDSILIQKANENLLYSANLIKVGMVLVLPESCQNKE